MRNAHALILALALPLTAYAQTNVFVVNYTDDGVITRGQNRSILYPADSKPTMLTPTYKPPKWYGFDTSQTNRPRVGDVIKYTRFLNKTGKDSYPACNWQVTGVTNLGSVVRYRSGKTIASTNGTFVKVTFCLSNTAYDTLYWDPRHIAIRARRDEKDMVGKMLLPHVRSDKIVGKNEGLTSQLFASFTGPGRTTIYSAVYEVLGDIRFIYLTVFPLTQFYSENGELADAQTNSTAIDIALY